MYLATDVSQASESAGPDKDERLNLEMLDFDAAVDQAVSGQLRDSKTIIGLCLADALARRGECPSWPRAS